MNDLVKVTPSHTKRTAFVYIRRSSPAQVGYHRAHGVMRVLLRGQHFRPGCGEPRAARSHHGLQQELAPRKIPCLHNYPAVAINRQGFTNRSGRIMGYPEGIPGDPITQLQILYRPSLVPKIRAMRVRDYSLLSTVARAFDDLGWMVQPFLYPITEELLVIRRI